MYLARQVTLWYCNNSLPWPQSFESVPQLPLHATVSKRSVSELLAIWLAILERYHNFCSVLWCSATKIENGLHKVVWESSPGTHFHHHFQKICCTIFPNPMQSLDANKKQVWRGPRHIERIDYNQKWFLRIFYGFYLSWMKNRVLTDGFPKSWILW